MRALIYDGRLHLEVVPTPHREGDQALLKIRLAGICNTDLELMAGMYGFRGILGHEFVAQVEEGPAEMIGRRVAGEINVACTRCDFCQKGVPSQCRDRTTVGIIQHPGAFADYLALTTRNLHIVPENVPDEAAVFVEPLAAALQISEAVHVSPRDRVVVVGLGKLGMLAAQTLKLTGADVLAAVRRNKQAALLETWGVIPVQADDLDPQRAQIVVDCTGQASGFADALRLVEPRGTIVLKSTYHGLPQADLTTAVVNEVRVVGSRCGPFDAALRLLKAGLIDTQSLIEARYPFDRALDAMAHAAEKGALKVLLEL